MVLDLEPQTLRLRVGVNTGGASRRGNHGPWNVTSDKSVSLHEAAGCGEPGRPVVAGEVTALAIAEAESAAAASSS
jgi:hypothetical protein